MPRPHTTAGRPQKSEQQRLEATAHRLPDTRNRAASHRSGPSGPTSSGRIDVERSAPPHRGEPERTLVIFGNGAWAEGRGMGAACRGTVPSSPKSSIPSGRGGPSGQPLKAGYDRLHSPPGLGSFVCRACRPTDFGPGRGPMPPPRAEEAITHFSAGGKARDRVEEIGGNALPPPPQPPKANWEVGSARDQLPAVAGPRPPFL